jgi:hypothetical protein
LQCIEHGPGVEAGDDVSRGLAWHQNSPLHPKFVRSVA